MKKILILLLTLAGSIDASAQSTSETPLGKNYWGIRQGFNPASHGIHQGVVYTLPRDMNMQLDFIYGFRLNRSFFLETGLMYNLFQSPAFVSYPNYNGIARETFSSSQHMLTIPLGLRYRSGGEKWRFTANTQLLSVGLGLSHTRIRGVNSEGQLVQRESRFSTGLGTNLMLNLGAGLEYQLAPQWTFRGEVNMNLSKSLLSPSIFVSPSYHLGLFKTIGKGKKF